MKGNDTEQLDLLQKVAGVFKVLLGAQIRALGRSSGWHRQNNFWFKQGLRSEETTNKRLEAHP